VAGTLEREADTALGLACQQTGLDAAAVLTGLLSLVTIDALGQPVRRRIPRRSATSLDTAFDVFVARRLLTADTVAGVDVIGVAHEAILNAWPPLKHAIADQQAALRSRRDLEAAADTWQRQGHSKTQLWERGQLAAAVTNLHAHTSRNGFTLRARIMTASVELDPVATDFLHASIRHDRSIRRRTTTVLIAFLLLVATGAGAAILARQDAVTAQHAAQDQQRVATARQLLAQAANIEAQDPTTALQLAIAAAAIAPSSETQTGLFNINASTLLTATLTDHTGRVDSVAFSPDGHTLATRGDHTVRLWDLTNRTQPQPLGSPFTGTVTSLAFSPDGNTLATASGEGTVRLWDLTDRTHPQPLGSPLTGHTNAVLSVASAQMGTPSPPPAPMARCGCGT
jgi:hypothetical protein